MKKRLTLKDQYKKEVTRLKRGLKNAEKRGFFVPDTAIPKIPKKVSRKQLERIKSIKPADIYLNKGEYVDIETGEVLNAKYGQYLRRSRAAKKAAETRRKKKIEPQPYYPTISRIDLIRDKIEDIDRKYGTRPMDISARKFGLLTIFDDTVSEYELKGNIDEYEQYLISIEEDLNESLDIVEYASDQDEVSASFIHLARLINNGTLSQSQSEMVSLMAELVNGF